MRALILALLLAACGAQPNPLLRGASRTEVSRDGRQYVVFATDKLVEVIRLGYAHRGEHEAIRATMISLISEVTGCRVVPSSLKGDSGEMHGRLTACPG